MALVPVLFLSTWHHPGRRVFFTNPLSNANALRKFTLNHFSVIRSFSESYSHVGIVAFPLVEISPSIWIISSCSFDVQGHRTKFGMLRRKLRRTKVSKRLGLLKTKRKWWDSESVSECLPGEGTWRFLIHFHRQPATSKRIETRPSTELLIQVFVTERKLEQRLGTNFRQFSPTWKPIPADGPNGGHPLGKVPQNAFDDRYNS